MVLSLVRSFEPIGESVTEVLASYSTRNRRRRIAGSMPGRSAPCHRGRGPTRPEHRSVLPRPGQPVEDLRRVARRLPISPSTDRSSCRGFIVFVSVKIM
jgi:hypothetical protein